MNCRNCGAPMELFERRRYYFCQHCGSFHFLGTESAGADGVQVLERAEAAAPCPVCSAPLAKALLDSAHTIEYCERCRGVLVSRGSFVDVTTARRAYAAGSPAPPQPIDRRELQRRMKCPKCSGEMEVHPYYGPGNVVIDTCSRCDVIWLDHGELKQIADAPGRDRGRFSAPVDQPWPQSQDVPPAIRALDGGKAGSLADLLAELLDRN